MNLNLGLDAAALERRRRYITASDAGKLLEGRWREVYRSKMGAPDDDLSNELRVQLGSFTEPFNLAWCWKQTGREVIYYSDNPLHATAWKAMTGGDARPEFVVNKVAPFMACSLDGMTTTPAGEWCTIDAKHVGQANDATVERYTAACTHQATVMATDFWALSFFVGNSRWELRIQEVDPIYQAHLIATEREFWGYVERGEEPEDRTPGAPPPKPQPKLRVVQLEDEFRDAWQSLNWAPRFISLIEGFAGTEAAAKKHAIIRKEMAEVIPPDVGEITRGLFKAKRDKAGAIRLSLKKGASDEDDGHAEGR